MTPQDAEGWEKDPRIAILVLRVRIQISTKREPKPVPPQGVTPAGNVLCHSMTSQAKAVQPQEAEEDEGETKLERDLV